jgi:hypothetical protein
MQRGKRIVGASNSCSRGLGRGHVEDNDRLTLVEDLVGDTDMLSPVEGHYFESSLLPNTHRRHVSEHMIVVISFFPWVC